MARFYFNLRDDMSVDDHEGLDLPDLTAAGEQAERFALDMAAASVRERGKLDLHHRIEVTDDLGEHLLTVKFGDVVTVES